jgi:OFA family oxalate/formate antiporter-like MFS transporter
MTWALAGAAGIAMIPLSTSFGLARGLGISQAVMILTAFNLANGLSRPASGYLSDIIGRNLTMSLAFLAGGCAYFLMPLLNGLAGWCILAAVVGYAFGTLFAVSAPLASDCFGLAHFGAILGLVFTGYGFVAGPLGPWLSGLVLDATEGNFSMVFSYLGSFYVVTGIVIWFTRPTGRTLRSIFPV